MSSAGYVLCGSPAYLAKAGMPLHPDHLADHQFVGYVSPGTVTRFQYRFVIDGTERSLSFPSQLTVDDGEALVEAATRSVGLIMVPDYVVEPQIAGGRLIGILRSFETVPVPISIVHLPMRHASQASRALIAALRSGLPNPQSR